MEPGIARERFQAQRVARLATADETGKPHVVPIVFVVVDDTIYSPVDDVKPKRGTELRRLANMAANPQVAVLADHYEDDWQALWWVRAEGLARILHAQHREATYALEELAKRYQQYVENPPPGPVIAIDVQRWSGWAAGGE